MLPLTSPIPLVEAWSTAGAARAGVIVADGCMDLVTDGESVVVAGPDSRARWFTPSSASPLWGLRFHPGVLPLLLCCPASELVDQVVPLADVASVGLTPADLENPDSIPRLFGDCYGDGAPIRVTAMLQSGNSVDDVARASAWSVRQFRRLSASWFGYGPKHLQRILRVNRAEGLLTRGVSMTHAASLCGYADSSHLWRDRRDLATVEV